MTDRVRKGLVAMEQALERVMADGITRLNAELAEAKAEIERLRAALQKIVDDPAYFAEDASDIARAALNPKE